MDGHGVVQQRDRAKTAVAHQACQLFVGAQAPRSHGQQVIVEIGVAGLRALTGSLGHGLGQHQGATRGQRLENIAQDVPHRRVTVVMRHTDQGDDVRARGQRIGEETARLQLDTGLQPRHLQGATGDFEHRRQVKQRQLQVRVLARHGADKAALATTHIHQAAVACERVAAENFLQHKVLGRGHQLGVAGHGLQRRTSGRSGA